MKILIRASILAVVIMGLAPSQINTSKSTSTVFKNGMPVPMCPPDDPDACGIVTHRPW